MRQCAVKCRSTPGQLKIHYIGASISAQWGLVGEEGRGVTLVDEKRVPLIFSHLLLSLLCNYVRDACAMVVRAVLRRLCMLVYAISPSVK